MKKNVAVRLDNPLIVEAHQTRRLLGWTVSIGAIAALLVGGFYWLKFGELEVSGEKWGQFGDFFGGTLNPIISFIGTVAIVITVRLQIGQLRHMVSDSQSQATRGNLVQFQSTFFQLLELQNQIVNGATLATGIGGTLYGRDAFKLVLARLDNARGRLKESPINLYERTYVQHQDLLAHYFRTFYHLLYFIDDSDVEERQYYADLLRAQLSTSETTLLFYNGLSQWGIEKAKPLIEKYGLLKTLPNRALLPAELVTIYDPAAYRTGFLEE